jgi:SAM-dependent methyltransferase
MRNFVTAASSSDAVADLQQRIDTFLSERGDVRVLDAGCGPRSNLAYPPDTVLVGLDQDEVALGRNTAIDRAVVVDLDSWGPGADEEARFDLAVSWYVLEHVDKPARLLAMLARATAPNGLVVLAVPNLYSPKSLVAKFTPHSFHVWWRRRVLGRPLAGTPGHGPHPTTLRAVIAPRRLIARAYDAGLDVEAGWMFEDGKQRQVREKLRVTGPVWTTVRVLVRVLSIGILDARRTELLLLLRRRANPQQENDLPDGP